MCTVYICVYVVYECVYLCVSAFDHCPPCPMTSVLVFVCDTVQLNVSSMKCYTLMDCIA